MCHLLRINDSIYTTHPTSNTRYERPNESHMMQLAFEMAIKWIEICVCFFRALSKLVAHWCEAAAHLCVGNEIGSSNDVNTPNAEIWFAIDARR